MDEKISLEAIALYGDAYAEKVLDGFFSTKDNITGTEILSLCDVKQVNFFVISELFKSWKEENKKLKSHYFNYESPEVQEAMENLMSVLSKNISIDKAHFSPLLKRAVSQALLVIFDPYDFFSIIIAGKNNKLEAASFREEIKYLKVNKAPLERMLQKLDEKGVNEISGNEAFGVLDQILEEVNFTPEDVDDYIEKFSAIIPLDPNTFYVSKTTETISAVLPTQAPAINKPKVEIEEVKESNTVAVVEPEPTRVPQQQPRTSPPPVARAAATVNESLSREPRPTLVDKFNKINSIKECLTINQKFMFTKVLFHGDFELFSKAIEQLDRYDTLKAALRYIEDEHATTWDTDSEEFHEFMELVEKRFA